MSKQHSRTQRWRVVAACLAILVAMSAAPAVGAQTSDSEDVTVTANIVAAQSLVITLCDLSANFGSGLNSNGATPTGTTDTVVPTSVGTDVNNRGVYYRWHPSCGTATSFVEIQSSVAWDLSQCATDGTSTSSLAIGQSDLRFSQAPHTNYGSADTSTAVFSSCPPVGASPTRVLSGAIGTEYFDFFYFLRVGSEDTAGSFNATTTWTVTP